MRAFCIAAIVLGPMAFAPEARAQKLRSDDPVWIDPDNLSIPRPRSIELSTTYDVLEHTFHHRPRKGEPVPPALNVNTLGEVPDSIWFQNRIGRRDMTLAELVKGSDTGPGPDLSQPLEVISGKSAGITPGFTVKDAQEDVYFVKFDRREYPNLASAVDVIGSNFFHAIGYHVPQNFIVPFRREQIRVGEKAPFGRGALKRPMRESDIDDMLANVPRLPDGRYRSVMSRRVPGEVIGHFKFYGRRGDDPNDLFPHQHRRELRGYRVFSSWLNHDDSRANNTLETYLTDGGRQYVKHFLIDFSSILGAGSNEEKRISPQNPRAGNEYLVEAGPIWKAFITLGIWERPWRKVKYPVYPEIGNIEADFYHPHRWRPEYPNPAFERMQPADAFWAARIVSRFSDEAIRALVHTGEYTKPEGERYLAETIIKRRDKIVDHYFRQVNPLDGFELSEDGAALSFQNLGQKFGLAVEGYEHEWLRFDNQTGKTEPIPGSSGVSTATRLAVPSDPAEYLLVRIRTRSAKEPSWHKRVDVYLRQRPSKMIVGVERED